MDPKILRMSDLNINLALLQTSHLNHLLPQLLLVEAAAAAAAV